MNQITKTIQILRNGGLAIFPTDTVYGMGCRIDDTTALQRLFKIRNRPQEKAVLAVVDSVAMAEKYVTIPDDVRLQLIDKYWPGGLTIVLPCDTEKIPAIARGGGNTLGVRQTNNPILLDLIRGVAVPLVAPSANFAGEPTPKVFKEIDKRLLELVDIAIDEPSGGNMASTVIDCSLEPWKILREGAVKLSI